jgi:hypothetical protein
MTWDMWLTVGMLAVGVYYVFIKPVLRRSSVAPSQAVQPLPRGPRRRVRRQPVTLPMLARSLSLSVARCKVLAVETLVAARDGWHAGHARPVRDMSSVRQLPPPLQSMQIVDVQPWNPENGTGNPEPVAAEPAPEPAPMAVVAPEKPDALGKLEAIRMLYAKDVSPMDVYRLQQGEPDVIRRISRDHQVAVKTLAKAMGGHYDTRREEVKAIIGATAEGVGDA